MIAGAAMLLAGGTGHAQGDQVKRGPVPAWVTRSEPMAVPDAAAGLAFVRRNDTLIHLDDRGEDQYTGYRIRILHPNALQAGNLGIVWSPSSGPPTVHTINVHRGAEVIDVLGAASFDILRRENQLEAASLDGNLTAVLRVPDLRVGDELEVEFTTRLADPTLGALQSGFLAIGTQPAPGRFRMGLSWDRGQEPTIKPTPDVGGALTRGDRFIDVRFDNPEPLALPKEAPARYAWRRVVEFSDFTNWQAISRQFAPLFAKAAAVPGGSALDAEAQRIAAAHALPIDRARAALKLVQQDVRYIYVGLDDGNLRPASAEDTWKRRYGDCKGKTALLLGLLSKLGIEAEPVLASNAGIDDGLDSRLPSPRMFDHVLVRVQIDGKPLWLDGTLPPVVGPAAAPFFPYRWVLPLTGRGTSIERLPWRPAARPDTVNLFEIDARDGFDKAARIKTVSIQRGIEGLQQQAQFSAVTPAQLLATMRQQATGDTFQSIDDVTWRYDEKAQASILTISGTGTIDWDDDGEGARSLALPGGGFSPPEKRLRPAGEDDSVPFANEPRFSCYVTTVRLPKGTERTGWSHKPGYDTRMFGQAYYRAFDLRDGAMRMVRGFRTEQQEIDAATARQDNARLPKFDNSMAYIFYNPRQYAPAEINVTRVPATDEIDWSAESVPCLAPSASG